MTYHFVAREQICSERHANVSGRQQKLFLSQRLGGYVLHLSLAYLATLGDTLNKILAMAKLEDMSRATLYSACLPWGGGGEHASDKRATCPPSHLHFAETRNISVVSSVFFSNLKTEK